MAINYTTLANEINTDPLAYGYAALVAAGSDAGVADLLNTVRAGADGKPAITTRRADIAPSEILEAIDNRDFGANPASSLLTWFQALMGQRTIRLQTDAGADTNVVANLRRLVTSNTNGSLTRLNAAATRFGSRAEQLFGAGVFVDSSDVARALRG